jgi:hypothetical protein
MRTRLTVSAAALLAALLMGACATADENQSKGKKPKEPTATQLRIAKAIANGHSYEKHVVDEKLFPEVKSRDDFIEVIANVLANRTHHRNLQNDREAYFDKESNTIVIYNPHARDKGTCFRPRAGLKYFENLK